MNIAIYEITAAFEVVSNGDSVLPPADAEGMTRQLRTAITDAVREWQDKLRGTVMVSAVGVTVSVPQPLVSAGSVAPAPVEPPAPAPAPAPAGAPTEPGSVDSTDHVV